MGFPTHLQVNQSVLKHMGAENISLIARKEDPKNKILRKASAKFNHLRKN